MNGNFLPQELLAPWTLHQTLVYIAGHKDMEADSFILEFRTSNKKSDSITKISLNTRPILSFLSFIVKVIRAG